MANPTPDISVIVPVYNELENIPELLKRIHQTFQNAELSYELILVDDGSTDGSRESYPEFIAPYPQATVVLLSRNFGQQPAISAGINRARGKTACFIDADLQDPPEVIPDMLKELAAGYDVIYGKRTQRDGETFFKKATSKLFYKSLSWLASTEIPRDAGDFRVMNRKALDALKALPERRRFLRGMISWIGFKQKAFEYERHSRFAGETHYTLTKMIQFAAIGITSFSTAPLRFVTYSGLLILSLSLIASIVVIAVKFTNPDYFLPGFTPIILLLMFFGGFQTFCMGLVGEYVGRVYDEAKGRPLYIVSQILQSHDPDE
ncbi:glycosyltransferase family 2 protein [Pelagicoccus mobilis]|uniref:Glycosyltransferase family 2 protein n=1 Tax=Pelagicoccus mobilis TaxID=415221 RepID=A0A934RV46_9BACT|nr:glycosyltransferase family 2 protein [Pelagicoccus mobilis]MBK1878230.1 glycosyltransferase family 2 protein [Pelagicoccus mobilis]